MPQETIIHDTARIMRKKIMKMLNEMDDKTIRLAYFICTGLLEGAKERAARQ